MNVSVSFETTVLHRNMKSIRVPMTEPRILAASAYPGVGYYTRGLRQGADHNMARTGQRLPNYASTPYIAFPHTKRKERSEERSKSNKKKSRQLDELNESYLDSHALRRFAYAHNRHSDVNDLNRTVIPARPGGGENDAVARFGLLPPFRTDQNAFTDEWSRSVNLDTLSEGGADGFSTDMPDDQALTVGTFKQCMDGYMDKFANRFASELVRRDEYMNMVTDVVNVHTDDIGENRHRIAELEQKEEERQKIEVEQKKKSKEKKNSVRDNIIMIDGIPEGETSRGELSAKVVEVFNKYYVMLKPFVDAELIGITRLGRMRTGPDAKPRTIKVALHSDWRKIDLLEKRTCLKGSQVYVNDELSKPMQDLKYNARLSQKADQIGKFVVRKDHVMILQGKGNPGIKLYDIPALHGHVKSLGLQPIVVSSKNVSASTAPAPMEVDPMMVNKTDAANATKVTYSLHPTPRLAHQVYGGGYQQYQPYFYQLPPQAMAGHTQPPVQPVQPSMNADLSGLYSMMATLLQNQQGQKPSLPSTSSNTLPTSIPTSAPITTAPTTSPVTTTSTNELPTVVTQ